MYVYLFIHSFIYFDVGNAVILRYSEIVLDFERYG